MNKKEKEKLVLDALELKVGDVVEITFNTEQDKIEKAEIIEHEKEYRLKYDDNITTGIYRLLQYNFTKLAPKKKKGELECSSTFCRVCPLFSLNCGNIHSGTKLYTGLETLKNYMPCKAYEEYKKILDEEVEE